MIKVLQEKKKATIQNYSATAFLNLWAEQKSFLKQQMIQEMRK